MQELLSDMTTCLISYRYCGFTTNFSFQRRNLDTRQRLSSPIDNIIIMYSLAVAHQIVKRVIEEMEREIDVKEVERLAPRTTGRQTSNAIETMVFISFAEKYGRSGKLKEERDPVPASIDNLCNGKIEKEEAQEKGQLGIKTSRIEDKSRSIATERSKQSYRSSKYASVKEQKEQEAKMPKQSFFVSLVAETEEDGVEEAMRQAENSRVNDEEKLKKTRDLQQQQRHKKALEGKKLVRDKRSFTFNYDGSSQGINPSKLAGETLRRMKDRTVQGEVVKKDRNTETSQIPNLKAKEGLKALLRGDAPIFSEKSFSVVQALGDDSNISEGVKITELRGASNAVLQHKAKKLQGVKMYRLKDYKNLSKEKSFHEFPKATSRKSSMLDISSSNIQSPKPVEDQKLKTVRKERVSVFSSGKSQEVIKAEKQSRLDEALGRGLPFIRTKGLKFYDIGSASNFKTVDFHLNSSEKRAHWRSRIKISDSELYEQVLLN